MKNFRFDTICNITQKLRKLHRSNCVYGFIGKYAVTKCHQLLSKVLSRPIQRNSVFNQLLTTSSSTLLNFEYGGHVGVITYRVLVQQERVSIHNAKDSLDVLIAVNSMNEWK